MGINYYEANRPTETIKLTRWDKSDGFIVTNNATIGSASGVAPPNTPFPSPSIGICAGYFVSCKSIRNSYC